MGKETNHLIYILKCHDGTLYTGYTTDLDRRLKMHNNGKGAKYTRGRGPFELVYCEQFCTKRDAMQMEYKVKQLSKAKKEELINSYQKGHDGNENTK